MALYGPILAVLDPIWPYMALYIDVLGPYMALYGPIYRVLEAIYGPWYGLLEASWRVQGVLWHRRRAGWRVGLADSSAVPEFAVSGRLDGSVHRSIQPYMAM